MSRNLWSAECRADLNVVRCQALDVAGVGHVFTTAADRRGRVFDVGPHGSAADPTWRERVLDSAGLYTRIIFDPRQVHGCRIVSPGEASSATEADGVVAFVDQEVSFAPAVRSADCVPLLLVATDGRALGAIHAGWRGLAAGIVERSIERLAARGAAPEHLLAAIGPAIGPCCYWVGEEVVAAMVRRFGSLVAGNLEIGPCGTRLGLGGLIRAQLIALGLSPGAVHCAPWCTGCAELPLFSYRREGATAGRQIACVGWLSA